MFNIGLEVIMILGMYIFYIFCIFYYDYNIFIIFMRLLWKKV